MNQDHLPWAEITTHKHSPPTTPPRPRHQGLYPPSPTLSMKTSRLRSIPPSLASPVTRSPPEYQGETQIRILIWNARSMNSSVKWSSITPYLGSHDIIFLQETWKSIQGPKWILNNRIDRPGGGTAIHLGSAYERLQPEKTYLFKDCIITKIHYSGNRYLWMVNVYLPDEERAKDRYHLFDLMQKVIPPGERGHVFLAGDWNMTPTSLSGRSWTQILKAAGFKPQIPSSNTRINNILDYAYVTSKIELSSIDVQPNGGSDHNPVLYTMVGRAPIKVYRTVPDRRTADSVWMKYRKGSRTCIQWLNKYRRLNSRKSPLITLPPPRYNSHLAEILPALLDPSKVLDEVSTYWREKYQEIEEARFSTQQRKAFLDLKKVTRYAAYDKRDGSIATKFLVDGKIIDDPAEVDGIIMSFVENSQGHVESHQKTDFKPIGRLSHRVPEIHDFGSKKGLALDLVTTAIFKRDWAPIGPWKDTRISAFAAQLLEVDLTHYKFPLKQRLIPLNKNHPQLPGPQDIRPIVVGSPIIKLIEANFLPFMRATVLRGIDNSQIGFVPGQDVFVNIHRAIRELQRPNQRSPKYALFIDLKNAYGSIPRITAINRAVKRGLPKEQAEYLLGLYDNLSIKIGTKSITPRHGVAQGSLLSPFLFNIYFDDLIKDIRKYSGLGVDRTLAYADDIMLICETRSELRNAIISIERVCQDHALTLNTRKSGIVEITRGQRKLLANTFEGIPVQPTYKYLGTHLGKNLDPSYQFMSVKMKFNFLYKSLGPLLRSSNLDMRINMWTCFIRPLLEYCLPTIAYSGRTTDEPRWKSFTRRTFRLFTGLAPQYRTSGHTTLWASTRTTASDDKP